MPLKTRTSVVNFLAALLLSLVFLSATSCQNLPVAERWVGQGQPFRYDGEVKDDITLMARFNQIVDMAQDDEGNLYVLDYTPRIGDPRFNNTLLRKISPDGEVKTIAGVYPPELTQSVYPEILYQATRLAYTQGHLYFTPAGCLIKVKLQEVLESEDFKVMYGKCLTPEDILVYEQTDKEPSRIDYNRPVAAAQRAKFRFHSPAQTSKQSL
ncbi:MAG: hypothetical protein ACO1RX_04735 [Candidatus Sericytochromatia bacterium]